MQTLSVILSYLAILLWVFGLYLAFFSHLRTIFRQSVAVIWKRKYLWLLAFFAGLSAYGGEVNFIIDDGYFVGFGDYRLNPRLYASFAEFRSIIDKLKARNFRAIPVKSQIQSQYSRLQCSPSLK